jgi:hypothetical protein
MVSSPQLIDRTTWTLVGASLLAVQRLQDLLVAVTERNRQRTEDQRERSDARIMFPKGNRQRDIDQRERSDARIMFPKGNRQRDIDQRERSDARIMFPKGTPSGQSGTGVAARPLILLPFLFLSTTGSSVLPVDLPGHARWRPTVIDNVLHERKS